jgi:AcrR family transcriptional regulator
MLGMGRGGCKVAAVAPPRRQANGKDRPVGRVRLDRDTILAGAERIVAAEGVQALSMRRIGAELGADPTALYRHYRSKDELLRAIAERLFENAPPLDPADDWRVRLRVELRHERSRYLVHPDLALLLARRPDDDPYLAAMNERVLALLAEAGLDPAGAARIFHLIENVVVGSGLFATLLEHADDPRVADPAALRRTYASFDPAALPHAVAAAPHLFPPQNEIFDTAVDVLIDAIERAAESA